GRGGIREHGERRLACGRRPAPLSRSRGRAAHGDLVRLRHRHDVCRVSAAPGSGAPARPDADSLAGMLPLRRAPRSRRSGNPARAGRDPCRRAPPAAPPPRATPRCPPPLPPARRQPTPRAPRDQRRAAARPHTRVAAAAAPRIVGRAAIVAHERIDVDQWTVGRYVRDRPLHRFDFDDPAGTSIYVSGTAGQIVLWTTATQRFWNWLGTIPHWLYFT